MNKQLFLLLTLVSVSFSSVFYTVNTDRSGLSSVTLSLEGVSSANVTLPQDAKNFRVVGGSYEIVDNVALVSSGATGITIFSFSSGILTTKTSTGWKLSFSSPDDAIVQVYMPPFATIENSYPQPKSVSSEDSRTLVVMGSSNPTTIYYRLEEVPQTIQEDSSPTYLLAATILIAAIIIAVSLLRGKGAQKEKSTPEEKQPTLEITSGKKEMMETFNKNDIKIVNYLIGKQGKSKRNEIERSTNISKSSLAMALKRLEKRKILEVDRGSTTHFVKLSDYFLKL
jgi:uncharacterized membrane protein